MNLNEVKISTGKLSTTRLDGRRLHTDVRTPQEPHMYFEAIKTCHCKRGSFERVLLDLIVTMQCVTQGTGLSSSKSIHQVLLSCQGTHSGETAFMNATINAIIMQVSHVLHRPSACFDPALPKMSPSQLETLKMSSPSDCAKAFEKEIKFLSI